MRSRRTAAVVTAAAVLSALLSGCGLLPGTSKATPVGTATNAEVSPSAEASSAAAPGASPAATGQPSPAELCAFLAQTLPNLQGKDPLVAAATLTAGLQVLYAPYGGVGKADGNYIDTATQQQCPETRAAVLKAAGFSDLTKL